MKKKQEDLDCKILAGAVALVLAATALMSVLKIDFAITCLRCGLGFILIVVLMVVISHIIS